MNFTHPSQCVWIGLAGTFDWQVLSPPGEREMFTLKQQRGLYRDSALGRQEHAHRTRASQDSRPCSANSAHVLIIVFNQARLVASRSQGSWKSSTLYGFTLRLHSLAWDCLGEMSGTGKQSQSHGSSEKQPLVGPRKEGSLNTHCIPAGESVNSGFHISHKRGPAVILVFQMGKPGLSTGQPIPKLRSSGCGCPSQADLTCLGLEATRTDLNCSLLVSPYLQRITNVCNDFYQKKLVAMQ